MPLRSFTDEEIRAFKIESAKSHDGRVVQIDIDAPIELTVIAAPFNRAEYAAHVDARMRDTQTSHVGAMHTQLLSPSLAEIEEWRQEWAMLPEHVANALRAEAGMGEGGHVVRRLNPESPPDGLSIQEARALAEKHKESRLWAVELPSQKLTAVMLAPVSDTWLAANAQEGDARAKCEGIVASLEPYVLGSIVWQNRPLTGGTGVLDRKPAIFWDLVTAYKTMGGDGAAVRRKSL